MKVIESIESQWEGLSHILWKIKSVWNHQPVIHPTGGINPILQYVKSRQLHTSIYYPTRKYASVSMHQTCVRSELKTAARNGHNFCRAINDRIYYCHLVKESQPVSDCMSFWDLPSLHIRLIFNTSINWDFRKINRSTTKPGFQGPLMYMMYITFHQWPFGLPSFEQSGVNLASKLCVGPWWALQNERLETVSHLVS